jgi:hypothetical protein
LYQSAAAFDSFAFFKILHDRRRFAVHGKNNRPPRFPQVLDKVAGLASETGQRLDILRYIKQLLSCAPFEVLSAYSLP